jgi:hypothetical protein
MWLKTFLFTRTRFRLLWAIVGVIAVAAKATVSHGENLHASSAHYAHGYFVYVGTYTDAALLSVSLRRWLNRANPAPARHMFFGKEM